MWRFLGVRLASLLLVLLTVSLLTFVIIHAAPGDPARLIAGPQAEAATVARIHSALGLDQPVWRQYLAHAGRLLHGDLGTSNTTGRPVIDEIATRAPASLELLLASLGCSLLLGVTLGVVAALARRSVADRAVSVLAVAGAAVPAFWLGLLLIVVFYRELGWFPASGRFAGTLPLHRTGFITLDALLAGDLRAFRIACAHLALPMASLTLLDLGTIARLTRNQMTAVLAQDYIRVARAAGLSLAAVVRHHALRNGLSPLVTMIAGSLATLLYGSVSVETVFGWPGTGRFVVDAIFNLDFPVVLGFAVVTSAVYVLVNAIGDLAHAALDPRVRLT